MPILKTLQGYDLRDASAVSTIASQGLTDTQKANALQNIGLGDNVTYYGLSISGNTLTLVPEGAQTSVTLPEGTAVEPITDAEIDAICV